MEPQGGRARLGDAPKRGDSSSAPGAGITRPPKGSRPEVSFTPGFFQSRLCDEFHEVVFCGRISWF